MCRLVTVDCDNCPDPDDAIGLERIGGDYLVTVAITDLTEAIPGGSIWEQEALRRGVTYYDVAGRNIYMFPEHLATDVLCLGDSRPRRVIKTEMLISRGQIVETRIFRDVASCQARLTYAQAKSIMDNPDHEFHEMLVDLNCVGQELNLCRGQKEGDSDWVSEAYGEKKGLTLDEVAPARMVEELMIANNVTGADFAYANDFPTLFRNHLLQNDRAFFSPDAIGHVGLRVPRYCWQSSPLRRVSDYVNQCNQVAVLEHRDPPFGYKQLHAMAPRLSHVVAI